MKQVTVKEWGDLTDEQKDKARGRELDACVEFELDCLSQDLSSGIITSEEYQAKLGCSAYYAETTPWFIPSCYYKAHKADIDSQVDESLNGMVYSQSGMALYLL